MSPATSKLFQAIVSADITAARTALAAGADVNATDERGRNVVSYAALGAAIDALDAAIRPRLSERRLEILQLVTQQPELSLYSLNAPLAWAGGVTLLSLMSWLNMPSEIMCLLDFTRGLLEVNAMDNRGATALMYAARDGNLQVVQRLLAHGARPDLKDVGQRSAIEYALPHVQLQWLCEEALRRSRQSKSITSAIADNLEVTPATPSQFDRPTSCLFFSPERLLSPPSMTSFDGNELKRTFNTLLSAIRLHDVDTFRSCLSSTSDSYALTKTPPSPGTFLVNCRDSTGLTLTHHVVCQRPCPNIAILDALHSAGSDVGIFSTLGFSPLHHLSRTARDDAKGADAEQGHSRPYLNPRTHPLYTFTIHLVQNLRAPLRAIDSKGETPLHSAAEHGHSISVLLAMLDADRVFSGKAAVREMRNERGLRPVDVARPEFLPFFQGPHHSHPTLPSDLKRKVLSPPNNLQPVLGGQAVYGSLHVRSTALMRQESHTSLMSKSSNTSSRSSATRSIGSQRSAHRSNPYRLSMRTTPFNALPTPEASPPSSFSYSPQAESPLESNFPIDPPACAADILDHLSFSANALHAYTQLYTGRHQADLYEMDVGSFPEFPVLADLLLFTRDLASHVLEHWTAQLDSVGDEFERARQELAKANALREQIGRDVSSMSGHLSNSDVKSNNHVEARIRKAKSGGLRIHASVQTDWDSPASAEDVHLSGLFSVDTESSQLGSGTEAVTQTPSQVDHGLRSSVGSGDPPYLRNVGAVADEDTNVIGSVNLVRTPLTLELSNEENCAVGREVAEPAPRSLSHFAGDPFPRNNTLDSLPSSPGVPMVPLVLQRADQDLSSVLAYFAIVQQSYAQAQEAIAQTHTLVEESIKIREEKLTALVKISHRQDPIAHPSRLSPILERSPEARGDAITIPSVDPRVIAALGPIEESHVLRRLLMRKLAKHVEKVVEDLKKAHVWLRIIREVLRGLRRRVLIDQFASRHLKPKKPNI